MKKKLIVLRILYHILVLGVYWLFLRVLSLWGKLNGGIANIGITLAVVAVWLITTPILICVLMRFSLFKWYIDPIAAAEIPFYLYFIMVVDEMKDYSDGFLSALKRVNDSLSVDYGWLYFTGLFVLGLLMSFSIERKNGESISFRLLAKKTKAEKQKSQALKEENI